MPFQLDCDTREITEIVYSPPGPWRSGIFQVNLLTEYHAENVYTPLQIRGLFKDQFIIVQSKDEAWDLEYSTRSNEYIPYIDGPPNPIYFK